MAEARIPVRVTRAEDVTNLRREIDAVKASAKSAGAESTAADNEAARSTRSRTDAVKDLNNSLTANHGLIGRINAAIAAGGIGIAGYEASRRNQQGPASNDPNIDIPLWGNLSARRFTASRAATGGRSLAETGVDLSKATRDIYESIRAADSLGSKFALISTAIKGSSAELAFAGTRFLGAYAAMTVIEAAGRRIYDVSHSIYEATSARGARLETEGVQAAILQMPQSDIKSLNFIAGRTGTSFESYYNLLTRIEGLQEKTGHESLIPGARPADERHFQRGLDKLGMPDISETDSYQALIELSSRFRALDASPKEKAKIAGDLFGHENIPLAYSTLSKPIAFEYGTALAQHARTEAEEQGILGLPLTLSDPAKSLAYTSAYRRFSNFEVTPTLPITGFSDQFISGAQDYLEKSFGDGGDKPSFAYRYLERERQRRLRQADRELAQTQVMQVDEGELNVPDVLQERRPLYTSTFPSTAFPLGVVDAKHGDFTPRQPAYSLVPIYSDVGRRQGFGEQAIDNITRAQLGLPDYSNFQRTHQTRVEQQVQYGFRELMEDPEKHLLRPTNELAAKMLGGDSAKLGLSDAEMHVVGKFYDEWKRGAEDVNGHLAKTTAEYQKALGIFNTLISNNVHLNQLSKEHREEAERYLRLLPTLRQAYLDESRNAGPTAAAREGFETRYRPLELNGGKSPGDLELERVGLRGTALINLNEQEKLAEIRYSVKDPLDQARAIKGESALSEAQRGQIRLQRSQRAIQQDAEIRAQQVLAGALPVNQEASIVEAARIQVGGIYGAANLDKKNLEDARAEADVSARQKNAARDIQLIELKKRDRQEELQHQLRMSELSIRLQTQFAQLGRRLPGEQGELLDETRKLQEGFAAESYRTAINAGDDPEKARRRLTEMLLGIAGSNAVGKAQLGIQEYEQRRGFADRAGETQISAFGERIQRAERPGREQETARLLDQLARVQAEYQVSRLYPDVGDATQRANAKQQRAAVQPFVETMLAAQSRTHADNASDQEGKQAEDRVLRFERAREEHQNRITQILAGPGGELAVINKIYDRRLQQIDVEKRLRGESMTQQEVLDQREQARAEHQEQTLQLVKQQQDQARGVAGSLYDAAIGQAMGNRDSLKNFGRSLLVSTGRQILTNSLDQAGFNGFGLYRMLPKQYDEDESGGNRTLNRFGRALAKTPFAVPLTQLASRNIETEGPSAIAKASVESDAQRAQLWNQEKGLREQELTSLNGLNKTLLSIMEMLGSPPKPAVDVRAVSRDANSKADQIQRETAPVDAPRMMGSLSAPATPIPDMGKYAWQGPVDMSHLPQARLAGSLFSPGVSMPDVGKYANLLDGAHAWQGPIDIGRLPQTRLSNSLFAPGVSMPDMDAALPFLPRYAKGKVVTQPTVAMIGEAGPEAVIPLQHESEDPVSAAWRWMQRHSDVARAAQKTYERGPLIDLGSILHGVNETNPITTVMRGLDDVTRRMSGSQTGPSDASFGEAIGEYTGRRSYEVKNDAKRAWNWLTSQLPHFAEGVVVGQPTVAMIGEAGPEAVIPLGSGAVRATRTPFEWADLGEGFYGDTKLGEGPRSSRIRLNRKLRRKLENLSPEARLTILHEGVHASLARFTDNTLDDFLDQAVGPDAASEMAEAIGGYDPVYRAGMDRGARGFGSSEVIARLVERGYPALNLANDSGDQMLEAVSRFLSQEAGKPRAPRSVRKTNREIQQLIRNAGGVPHLDVNRPIDINRALSLYPDIPQFADGRIVTKPTVAVIGEKGPEVVIPIDPEETQLSLDQIGKRWLGRNIRLDPQLLEDFYHRPSAAETAAYQSQARTEKLWQTEDARYGGTPLIDVGARAAANAFSFTSPGLAVHTANTAIAGDVSSALGMAAMGLMPWGRWGRNLPKLADLPKFADGGVVGLTGEAGPEAVMPLDQLLAQIRRMVSDTTRERERKQQQQQQQTPANQATAIAGDLAQREVGALRSHNLVNPVIDFGRALQQYHAQAPAPHAWQGPVDIMGDLPLTHPSGTSGIFSQGVAMPDRKTYTAPANSPSSLAITGRYAATLAAAGGAAYGAFDAFEHGNTMTGIQYGVGAGAAISTLPAVAKAIGPAATAAIGQVAPLLGAFLSIASWINGDKAADSRAAHSEWARRALFHEAPALSYTLGMGGKEVSYNWRGGGLSDYDREAVQLQTHQWTPNQPFYWQQFVPAPAPNRSTAPTPQPITPPADSAPPIDTGAVSPNNFTFHVNAFDVRSMVDRAGDFASLVQHAMRGSHPITNDIRRLSRT